MPTLSDMNRQILCSIILSVIAACAFAQGSTARLLANKRANPNFRPNAGSSFYQPVTSQAPTQAKYALVADYLSRALYEGPAANLDHLKSDLEAEGYSVSTPDDLAHVYLNGFRYDPFTRTTNSPPAPSGYSPQKSDGLFVLGLAGYPTPAWLQALQAAGVRLIEALPPSGYLVRMSRAAATNLSTDLPFVRAVFAVTPGGKKALLASATEQPFQSVFIQAVEEQPQESIEPQLRALSAEPIQVVVRKAPRAVYIASLSDLDIENLTFYETVYSVSGISAPEPSAERQAFLAIQSSALGPLTLQSPRPWPDYTQYLLNNGFTNFNATNVAMLDTGLDNGAYSGPAEHPDFTASTITCIPFTDGNCKDRYLHGTVTTSIVAGYPPNSNVDADGYFWDEGLAPTVPLIIDKFFNCVFKDPLHPDLNARSTNTIMTQDFVGQPQPQVLNYSLNSRYCGYDSDSQLFDRYTRLNGWLFTVSAGNMVKGSNGLLPCPGSPLQPLSPATAKDVIAVGATHNFTANWPPDQQPAHIEECDWCTPPPTSPGQDARNIPTMSPPALTGNILKPDLVAPGTRVTGPLSRDSMSDWCDITQSELFCNMSLASYLDNQIPAQSYSYGFSGGTSFSAPVAAGAAAVVRQWYSQTLRAGGSPSPALTKAILLNGARSVQGGVVQNKDFSPFANIKHVYFDPYQGWGAVNFDRLLKAASNYYIHEQSDSSPLQASDTWSQAVTVVDGSQPVRITLVWTDHPGGVGSPYVALNSLGLVATAGACVPCFFGNKFDSATGYSVVYNQSQTEETTNNVQEIIIAPNSYASGTVVNLLVHPLILTTNGIDPDSATPQQQDFAVFVTNAH